MHQGKALADGFSEEYRFLGDYAYLTQTDTDSSEPFQVALALLPPETDIGTKLRGFMGMFEIIT